MAFLVGSLAEIQALEFLHLREELRTYLSIQFIGVILAPCLVFHYAMSLADFARFRRWSVSAAYTLGIVFIAFTLASLKKDTWFHNVFFDPQDLFNHVYIAVYFPITAWAILVLAKCYRRAPDPRTRSLFTYPIAAGLVIMPTGFLELANSHGAIKTASFGCMVGSIILAIGVIRNRSIYDAFALLRKDAASVLRATVQGIVYVEPDNSILFCNRLARTLLGLEKEPRTLAEAGLEVPPEGRAVIRRGNRLIEVRVVKSAEVIPAGRLSLILQDKTRELATLQELASKDTLAALGQAAATLAHEIRNPLTTLKSSLDCATQDVDAGKMPERRHLELAQGEVKRLHELLERSLQLSRPLELQRESCDIGSLLGRTLDRMPAPDGVRVVREVESGLPAIQADPDLLTQLFANLIRNAMEAAREIRISVVRAGERLAVRIFSLGARIPDDILPRLFEPFVTSKTKGTGLGLALCRKIAAAHDARIEGRNDPAGVTFEVSFRL
jgi:signal transduction histidine kinase